MEITTTRVFFGVPIDAVGEPLDGREARDAVTAAKRGVLVRIHLGDQDLALLVAKGIAQFFIDLGRVGNKNSRKKIQK